MSDKKILYLPGDIVILKTMQNGQLPEGWAPEMAKYMGAQVVISNIDTFSYIDNTTFHIEEARDWTFWVKDIEGPASEDVIRKRDEELEKMKKGLIFSPEQVRLLAESIFGCERVDIQTYGSTFSLKIHFPELKISNSKGQEHIIRDIYAVIKLTDLNLYSAMNKASVTIFGFRTTFTLSEYRSRYVHSHLHSNRGMHESPFCLGSSLFGISLCRIGMSLQETDWMMMLLSLENYLKWESLEGGPYIKMCNICSDTSITQLDISRELNKIINDIPKDVWEIENEIRVIPHHPSLIRFLNDKFPIRSYNDINEESQKKYLKSANKYVKGGFQSLTWKGNRLECKVIPDVVEKDEKLKPVSPAIIEEIERLLNNKSLEFTKIIINERQKIKNSGRIFFKNCLFSSPVGKIRVIEQTHSDNNAETEKSDRLPT